MSHPEPLLRELQDALSAFGVHRRWDELAEDQRLGVLNWLACSMPDAMAGARIVAQRLSAGLSVEPDALTRAARRNVVRRRRRQSPPLRAADRRSLTKALLTESAEARTAAALPIRLWAAGLLAQSRTVPGNETPDDGAIAVVDGQHASFVAVSEMSFRSRDADPETLVSSLAPSEKVFAAALALQRPLNFGFLVVTSQRFGYLSLDEPRGHWIAQHLLAEVRAVSVRRRWSGARLSTVTSPGTLEYWKLASTEDAYRIALRLHFAQKMFGEGSDAAREALGRDVALAMSEGP